jgi:hypothetical protein
MVIDQNIYCGITLLWRATLWEGQKKKSLEKPTRMKIGQFFLNLFIAMDYPFGIDFQYVNYVCVLV